MVIIYTDNSKVSCQKAIAWLDEQKIKYSKIDIKKDGITKQELKNLLYHTENGLDDLLSHSGHAAELSDLSLHEALDTIVENPRLLKTPILYNGKLVQAGFNAIQIRAFIPKKKRTYFF